MQRTLLFALALIAAGCAEPPVPLNVLELVQQGDVSLDRETMRPYSGPILELSPDEQVVLMRGTLKNGVPDGLMESYNKRGQTIMGIVFRDGSMIDGDTAISLPDGPHEVYYDLTEPERDIGRYFREVPPVAVPLPMLDPEPSVVSGVGAS